MRAPMNKQAPPPHCHRHIHIPPIHSFHHSGPRLNRYQTFAPILQSHKPPRDALRHHQIAPFQHNKRQNQPTTLSYRILRPLLRARQSPRGSFQAHRVSRETFRISSVPLLLPNGPHFVYRKILPTPRRYQPLLEKPEAQKASPARWRTHLSPQQVLRQVLQPASSHPYSWAGLHVRPHDCKPHPSHSVKSPHSRHPEAAPPLETTSLHSHDPREPQARYPQYEHRK